ncbi:uncharacterized protein LOC118190647 isoform X2 [Stegodyphus dumicola]|uniref:uncharacterized protein LOC118190647 isoform X2 n=1 Tax=Stegodyphus dumicola TaxID=202533 RepID=UPI0015AD6702|nr:uncharacterized protein LOC118190647 isoform X2 [Stegodyphus dumicola]XP_035217291.1 uncharacterized protein LOC118190647 isoform X2 [Stegodyphus dumicola]XP_035217292.1 uncharacterized protein LOC118190647 isoform X2 [Stegodyphus dumicola]
MKENIIQTLRKTEGVLLKIITDMRKDIKYLMNFSPVNVVLEQNVPTNVKMEVDDPVEDILKMLPLKTLDELDLWEEIISDDDNFKNLVRAFGIKGGKTVDEATRRILAEIFTYEVSSKINWAGRGEKQSFKTFRSCRLIYKAVRSNPSTREATDKQMEDIIKSWFRYSPMRLQRKKGKEESTTNK